MIIKIEIECETIRELLSHLWVIKNTIKSQIRKQKITEDMEFKNSLNFKDSNCYGDHTLVTSKNK